MNGKQLKIKYPKFAEKYNINDEEYVPVVERVKEAHNLHKDLEILTEMITGFTQDETRIAVKAIVRFGGRTFTGHSQAVYGKGMMGDVALEIAETIAVDRALGFANIGLIDGIASADEMRKVGHSEFPSSVPPLLEEI